MTGLFKSSTVDSVSLLQELVKEVDPHEQLDEDVEELLLQIADDFIEQTVVASCALAKHRKSPNVDVRDVQVCAQSGRAQAIKYSLICLLEGKLLTPRLLFGTLKF